MYYLKIRKIHYYFELGKNNSNTINIKKHQIRKLKIPQLNSSWNIWLPFKCSDYPCKTNIGYSMLCCFFVYFFLCLFACLIFFLTVLFANIPEQHYELIISLKVMFLSHLSFSSLRHKITSWLNLIKRLRAQYILLTDTSCFCFRLFLLCWNKIKPSHRILQNHTE